MSSQRTPTIAKTDHASLAGHSGSHPEGGPHLEGLNEAQRAAATHTEGPLLILAGAGTGKTKTLASRAAHLIASKACTAKEIVIVTFTTQAAEEMRNRLAVYIGSDAKDITVKTFHALALSFLRKYPHLAQREPNASVLDEGDALAALTEVINTSVPWHAR